MHSGKYLDVLSDVSYCASLGRLALGGASSVRVVDASGTDYGEVKGDSVELDPSVGAVNRVGWTRDGQVRGWGG